LSGCSDGDDEEEALDPAAAAAAVLELDPADALCVGLSSDTDVMKLELSLGEGISRSRSADIEDEDTGCVGGRLALVGVPLVAASIAAGVLAAATPDPGALFVGLALALLDAVPE